MPISGIRFKLFVIGYILLDTHVRFALSHTVFKTYEKRYRRFRSKEVLGRHYQFRNLLWIRLISNKTSFRTIQGVTVHVISERSRASRSSDFENTRDHSQNCTLLDSITFTNLHLI